jgi:hypothetical protein
MGVGALVALSLTFYAGMAYENQRIQGAFEDAFSGAEDFDAGGDEGDGETVEAEPIELVENEPVSVATYEGEMTVTLISSEVRPEALVDEVLTRNLKYVVRIENSGSTPLSPALSPHYETDTGQVLNFAGVFCDEDSLPSDEIDPGQFVEGCETSDIPDDSGRLVFDDLEPTLYIAVEGA